MPEAPADLIRDFRRIEIDDVPWVLSLAYKRYRPFDPGTTLTWLAGVLRNPDALPIRTRHAFLIANIITSPWQPTERDCHVVFCCAAERYHWEAVRLVRQSITWARGSGCRKWWFSSETEFAIDQIARRVGAKPDVMRYSIELMPGVKNG